MRRRIQQLARGKFEQEKPSPVFSTDKVDIKALEGKDYSGDFVITSTNQNMMRGVVYSSNPRDYVFMCLARCVDDYDFIGKAKLAVVSFLMILFKVD